MRISNSNFTYRHADSLKRYSTLNHRRNRMVSLKLGFWRSKWHCPGRTHDHLLDFGATRAQSGHEVTHGLDLLVAEEDVPDELEEEEPVGRWMAAWWDDR